MKLRFLLPAAVATAALAVPTTVGADPTGQCPDHFVLTVVVANPDWADRDRNGDFLVCHKETPGNGDPTKDNRGVIISHIDDPNPDNWVDNDQ
jgi:hypothetical protein